MVSLIPSSMEWPYQSVRTRFAIVTILLLISATGFAPQVVAVVKHLSDWNFLLECVTSLIFDGFLATKFFYSIFNSKKMKKLLDHIRADWKVLAGDRSVDILHEYAERGRNMTIAYGAVAYTTCFLVVIQPVIPKIIDNLLRNGTEPGGFPVPVDYLFINSQKYYFYIVLHLGVGVFMAFQIVIAHDTLFIIYIHHGCGLYAVLGHKLQLIGKNKTSADTHKMMYALGKTDPDLKDLASCGIRHNEAIRYAQLVEATYSWCLFLMVGFNIILITITGLRMFNTTIEPQESLKLVLSNVSAIALLYTECYLAHILMEYSISIRNYIFNSEWYRLPPRVQKAMLFMIMRCNAPSEITAGHFFVMSMSTFTVVMKLSLSYFNFLRSI